MNAALGFCGYICVSEARIILADCQQVRPHQLEHTEGITVFLRAHPATCHLCGPEQNLIRGPAPAECLLEGWPVALRII